MSRLKTFLVATVLSMIFLVGGKAYAAGCQDNSDCSGGTMNPPQNICCPDNVCHGYTGSYGQTCGLAQCSPQNCATQPGCCCSNSDCSGDGAGYTCTNNLCQGPLGCGVGNSVDMAGTISGDAAVSVGSNVTFTVTATNKGNDPATAARLNITVPSNFQITSVTLGNTSVGQCVQVGNSIGCTLSDPNHYLYYSGFNTVTIVAKAVLAGVATTHIQAFSEKCDPDSSNNEANLTTTISNPVPTLTSLAPSSAVAGSAGFVLTVNGSNFVTTSVVRWNGADRATTYGSDHQLTVLISAADIAVLGTAQVTAFNPAPGGGTSNALPFSITSPVNNPFGFHDGSSCSVSSGWTCDADEFSQALQVHFYADGPQGVGTLIGQTVANVAREAAVAALCGGSANHGFSFNTPTTLWTGTSHSIYAYAVNAGPSGSDQLLSSSPKTISCAPIPAITSLNPSSKPANSPSFTLTVNGGSFLSGSVVQWNGSSTGLTTVFVNAGQLTVVVPASYITVPGTVNITVFTPDPGGGTSNSLPFTIVGPPVANNQTVTTAFQTARSILLTGTDFNSPPLALTYTLLTAPLHGIVSGTVPNIIYTPANGYAGADSFTFKVSNGFQESNAGTVSIAVNAPTTGPTANAQSVTVPFQTATAITLSGSDPGTPPLPLTYSLVGTPAHGTLSGTAPNLTYKPANGYTGADSFSFKVNNGFQDSNTAVVSITVGLPTAGAPTADAQSVTVPFQTAKAVGLTGTDHNTPPLPLSFTIVALPTHGTLSGSAPNMTYTPANGYAGPDSFTFKVNNGFQDSNTATVSISVNTPTVGAPTANSQTVAVPFQTPTAVVLSAVDHNTPPLALTFIIVGNPAHGTLSGSGANLTYTPANGYTGPDSFTFKANNGFENSNVASVSITVGLPAAGAPTADNQSVSVAFQTAKSITLTGTDHNTPPLPLGFTILALPTHGTLSGSAPNMIYTPTNGYAGTDSFTFKVNNGFQDSASGTVSLTIGTPTGAAPTANSQTISVPFQTAVAVTLTAVDHNTPALPLSYSVVGNPAHGTLSGTAPNLTYTPANGYSGPDSFTFKATNGFQESNVASISITVTLPTAGAPTVNSQSVTVPFQTPTSIILSGVDHNTPPLPLTYSVVGNPAHGTLSGTGANLTYTPANGYTGADSFTFKATNGFENSNVGSVSITVGLPTSGAPTADNQSVSVAFQTAKSITLTGSDHNTPPLPLTYTVLGNPVHGTLSGTLPNLTYTPANGYAGADSFTFKVNNGFQDSNAATVSITVGTPTAGAPTANSQNVTVPFQTATAIVLSGSDHNTPPLVLSYTIVGNPAHGTLTGTLPNLTYTPANGYSGPDSFTFKVNNGFQNSNTASVSITVSAPTTAPSANSQSVSTPFQTPVAITLTGVDPSTPPLPLTYTLVNNPAHGTLSGTAPHLTYTPANGYAGPDNFTFKVNNGFQDSNVATVSITVGTPTAGAPTANSQNVTVPFQTATAITLTAVDHNTPPLPLVYSLVGLPAHGTLSGTAPALTYTPANGYAGPDSFTFKVNNGFQNSNVASISITVAVPNVGAPTANAQNLTVPFQTATSVTLSGVDHNTPPLPLSFAIVTTPTHGTLSGSAPNMVYTPANGFAGIDSFTYKVNNGFQDSAAAMVAITVTPPTTAPTANPQNVSVPFQTATPILLSGADSSTPPLVLTYAVVTAPLHGVLTGTAPNVTYTPAKGYAGTDSFTFKVNNGFLDSTPATVSLTVLLPTAAPVANSQQVSVIVNTPKDITLSGEDFYQLPLNYSLMTPPLHGTLSGSGAQRTYTPFANYLGIDSFAFQVNDGYLSSNVAVVSIMVSLVGAPVALDQSVTVPYNKPQGITLVATDPGNLPLSYTVVAMPLHGSLSGSGANLVYTSSVGYQGSDAFAFKANNGFVDSNIATVSITVQSRVVDHVVVTPKDKTIKLGDSLQFEAHEYDQNNDEILGVTFHWQVLGAAGTISGAGAFHSIGGFYGTRQYTAIATDASGNSDSAKVKVLSPSPFADDICGAVAYPVPYKVTSGLPGVTFTRLAAGSKIRIFTSDARIVRTLFSQNGEDVVWDLRNNDGDQVASWVYFYIIEQNGPCDKKEGKLVIIK